MMKAIIIGIALLSATISSQTFAAPADAACNAAWDKADKNKDGFVTPDEAKEYFAAIEKSGKTYDTNKDGKLSKEEFIKACKDGVFASIE